MARRPHPAVAFTGAAVVAAVLGTMVPRPEIKPTAPPSWRERYRLTQPLPTTQVVQYWNYEPRGTPEASRPPGYDPEAERRRIIAEVEADNRAYARLMAEVDSLNGKQRPKIGEVSNQEPLVDSMVESVRDAPQE